MSKEDADSHTWESLIDRKRAIFFRDYLPCRSLAEWDLVPRMLRGAISAFTRVPDALWRCTADPGPSLVPRVSMGPGAAAHR